MFGIESSGLEDKGERFIQFAPLTSYPLPSLYPSYIFMEKAIANEVFRKFSRDNYHVLIPEKLVRLCIEILGVFYSQVDAASERRLQLMFDEYTRFLTPPNDVERVPPELKRNFMDLDGREYNVGRKDIQGAVAYGYATSSDQSDGAFRQPLNILEHSIALRERRVDRVWISVRDNVGVPVVEHLTTKGQNLALYVYNEVPPKETTVTIDEVINRLYSFRQMEANMEAIRQVASQMGAHYVLVEGLTTKIKLTEQTGFTDEPVAQPSFKIKIRREQAERRYSLDQLEVFYRLNNDEYSRDVNNMPGRGMLNQMFRTHIGMLYDDLLRFIVNYDGKLTDAVDLYDLEGQPKLRIMDGQGFIHSTPITIATRVEERYTLEKELKLRL
jgi:hypothetical protein